MLHDWLLSHFNPENHFLDLSLDYYVEKQLAGLIGSYHQTYYEDPSYQDYIPQFVHSPNSFLNEYHVKSLSLKGQINKWEPHVEMGNFIHDNQLTYLDLRNNGLEDTEVAKIAAHPSIHTLLLGQNNVGDTATAAISNNHKIKFLDLSDTGLTCVSLVPFHSNNTIQVLNVEANQLNTSAAKIIATMHGLQRLNISNNKILDEGGEAITQHLSHLQSINFKNCKIGTNTMGNLFKNPHLQYANVSWQDVGLIKKYKLKKVIANNNQLIKASYQDDLRLHNANLVLFSKQACAKPIKEIVSPATRKRIFL